MKAKRVIPREAAAKDVEAVVDYYQREAGPHIAFRFIESLAKAYDHIGRYPQTGSPLYAHELNLPGLRSWPLKRFPYSIFYLDQDEHIDVWRVLSSERDIPVWLRN